tara:strand:+ start:3992 stop:4339 length:348 start_codon:yes stop_codon:yes gene_type:complete
MKRLSMISLSLTLLPLLSMAQQAAVPEPVQSKAPATGQRTVSVDISTTISGNQEQPRTLYVLPWQDSIAQIRIPAPGLNVPPPPIQPLDRKQFLRFIDAQSLQQPTGSKASTKNN